MRVSVVGCGNISKCHLQNLSKLDNVTISSVVDIKHERADAAAEKYGAVAYYDFIKMLDEDKPDVIHICTPHYLHVDMAVEALSRGIHVLCEKPCAISQEGISKLRMARLMCNAQFGVCFQNRYNNSVKIIKDLLDSEAYGKIIGSRASVHWSRDAKYYNDDWHGTKAYEGGGVLINQAVHTLDLLTYLVGSNPVAVDGMVKNYHLKDIIEVEDTANARIEFANGTVGLFDATTAFSINARINIDIFCENAILRIEGDNAYKVDSDGIVELLTSTQEKDFIGKDYWGKGHESLIRDFYDCLENKRKFPIDILEGVKTVEQFLAVYKSSESGEKVYLTKD